MKTAWNTVLSAALAAAVGCGGSTRPDSTEPLETARTHQKHDLGGGHAETGGADMKEMVAMPPSVSKFHATLAPYWHAKQGPQRMTDTCAAIAELRAGADEIVASPPPERSDSAAWSSGGKQLAEAVTALEGTCKASDATAFETALAEVHERFHGLMSAAGGEHEDHSDHAH
jgi:hypothetical protein